jgi:very-short-patch-repair endonuclease
MTDQDIRIKREIDSALQAFSTGNLSQSALSLFAALGYNTQRQNPFVQKTSAEFEENFGHVFAEKKFNKDKARFDQWKSIDLLFQLSRDELSDQPRLFDTRKVRWEGEDKETVIETYLFFAIELAGFEYSRTAFAQITREVNKVFPMPVMVVFRHDGSLTISIINRRLHKKDEQKDVLEKVTLIKDISIANPHRAHIEILFDLSYPELLRIHRFTNFVELHNAWQKTLDTKELNKRFYAELSNWYFWAMDHVSFPDDVEKNKDVRNATSLIRLITRIIFVWFIKEKSLVPDALFDHRVMQNLLKVFNKDKRSDSYYRAILQNLFFGTLNQRMNERGFAKDGTFLENKNNYGVKNLFRYAGDFAVDEKEVLALFQDIPFLNGGLFDCLDKENDQDKVIYSDGFSRNPKKQASVPDFLFFGAEEDYDLNATYGTRNKRYKVKGLFNIFSSYKFTVAENTPVEEEVALDPELLGRVFENLLASYNPETKTTARKQTGSFYTPREIVNYMVDESLKAYLKQNLEKNSPPAKEGWQAKPDGVVEDSKCVEDRLNNLPHLKTFRKELRKNLTPAEAKLWTYLQNSQLDGRKFRRQHSVANYILDFYCPSEKLAIELDGEIHIDAVQAEYDKERDLFLQATGIQVLRFENKIVFENPQGLMDAIKNEFGWIRKTTPPLRGTPPSQGGELLDEKLSDLFSYSDSHSLFNSQETKTLINAIDNCKVLDPACGSGAFPMGVLHKLVHVLHKLDPQNAGWKERQISKARFIDDPVIREQTIADIEAAFAGNELDYGRKLYLIENCIYGVDIQPIAVQIAKLRFFISLVVDQKKNPARKNLGILSLPNLETKFVAANTLIGLDKPQTGGQIIIENPEVKKLEEDLKALRHQYFTARTRREKLSCQKKDNDLRKKISDLLEKDGWNKDTAHSVAAFDPYDQNASSPFFDPEWMFGVTDGFDVVIGNPPYGASYPAEHKKYFQKYYLSTKTIKGVQKGSLDTFSIFIEHGYMSLKENGCLIFIVPISITSSDSMTGLHRLLEDNCKTIKVSSYSVRPQPVFENAVVNTSILFFIKTKTKCQQLLATKMYRKNHDFDLQNLVNNLEFINVKDVKLRGRYPKISYPIERDILKKIFAHEKSLSDIIAENGKAIYYRTTGGRYFKVITNYSTGSTKERPISFVKKYCDSIGAILSSNLFFWFYQIFSNNLDLKSYEIKSFKIPIAELTDDNILRIENLYHAYLGDIEANANTHLTTHYTNIDTFKEYKIVKSKHLIDEIDDLICPLYGLIMMRLILSKIMN